MLGLSAFTGLVNSTPINARDACVYTCGSVCYWQTDIDAALAEGYSLYQSKKTLGESSTSSNGKPNARRGSELTRLKKDPMRILINTTTMRASVSPRLRRGMNSQSSRASRFTRVARLGPTGLFLIPRESLTASSRTLAPAVMISSLVRRTEIQG